MNKLTMYEIGQDLIAIQDIICDKYPDILNSAPECAVRLHKIKLAVGDLFRDFNDHPFEIMDNKNSKVIPKGESEA